MPANVPPNMSRRKRHTDGPGSRGTQGAPLRDVAFTSGIKDRRRPPSHPRQLLADIGSVRRAISSSDRLAAMKSMAAWIVGLLARGRHLGDSAGSWGRPRPTWSPTRYH